MSACNGTMMQYFHWYLPADGALWKQVSSAAPDLAELGITALWLPPPFKGAGGINDAGYGVYDLYDLGEFHQKGSIRTKYGDRSEYLDALRAARAAGLQVYADIVFNHRGGADDAEWVKAVRVRKEDRSREFTLDYDDYWIEAFTVFNFPQRRGKYSDFTWNWELFDGVDFAANFPRETGVVFKFHQRGKDWAKMVSGELGNYDYLMFSDIDMNHPAVRTELGNWGKWFLDQTGVDGFRLDAVKHIQFSFFWYWLEQMRRHARRPLFAVGEYWNPDNVEELHAYIQGTHGCMSLFDAPLHRNLHEASRSGGRYDMRRILDNTLTSQQPALAVTLVDNHDTQPCQALESWVDWWFKPLAYALILLRAEGYPCVFYPDLCGAEYEDKAHHILLAPIPGLARMIAARSRFAFGAQHDYFDHEHIIGWTREGEEGRPGSGLAVILSDGHGGSKWMHVGQAHRGKIFADYLENVSGNVTINEYGWGEFYCAGGSVSVWLDRTQIPRS